MSIMWGMFSASPSTVAPEWGLPVLSMMSVRVPNDVPYFLYSSPLMPTLALSSLFFFSSSKNSRCVGESGDMPRPTIATSRPPGCMVASASLMWLPATCKSFLSPMRPAVCENGGFITTTVGFTPRFGRMPEICTASSAWTWSAPNWSARNARRRPSISLVWTSAPAFFMWAAMLPFPADGSRACSPGWMFAAHAAAKA